MLIVTVIRRINLMIVLGSKDTGFAFKDEYAIIY